jgi:hypothetical protein
MKTIDLTDRDVKIEISQDSVSFSSWNNTYKPDPAWCLQDSAGHIHRWDLAAKKVHTIKTVVDEVFEHWDDGDYWTTEETHQECVRCGERIEPGYLVDVPAGQIVLVPTLKRLSGSYALGENDIFPEMGERYAFIIYGETYEAYITEMSACAHGPIMISFGA